MFAGIEKEGGGGRGKEGKKEENPDDQHLVP